MNTIELPLNDIACTGCIGRIRKKLRDYKGIEKVSIIQGNGKLQINYDEAIIQSEEIRHNLHKAALRTFD